MLQIMIMLFCSGLSTTMLLRTIFKALQNTNEVVVSYFLIKILLQTIFFLFAFTMLFISKENATLQKCDCCQVGIETG